MQVPMFSAFQRARITLTLWYIVVALGILVVINLAAGFAQKQAFVNRTATPAIGISIIPDPTNEGKNIVLRYRIPPSDRSSAENAMEIVPLEQIQRRFQSRLLLFEIVLLVVIAVAGYILSGITLAPIARAMKEQEEFAADASHELRTPLTVIATEIEVAKRTHPGMASETKQSLDSMQEEVKRMGHIVDGLLTMVRGSFEHEAMQREPIVVDTLVTQVVEHLRPIAKKREISCELTTEAGILVHGSSEQLRQVITILMDNAIKYSHNRGVVTVGVRKKGKHARITIKDEGVGIRKEDISHIFERFYRASGTGKQGSGLGLAIAKKIIAQHNGTIDIHSIHTKGTVAEITLPRGA